MMKEYTDIPLEKMRSVVSTTSWDHIVFISQQQHHRCHLTRIHLPVGSAL
jgi:hypothetical protein